VAPAELARGGPARDRQQDGVELVLGALLDTNLPPLAVQRQQVSLCERHQIVDEKLGGARGRRLDADRADVSPSAAAERDQGSRSLVDQ
jgi:hypothetical protein